MKNYTFYIIVLFLIISCNDSQQQGDNPTNEEKHVKATVEDVEQGIRQHIAEQSKENNGVFVLNTDTASYEMRLVRVHTEYLSVLGPGKYFACVDLAVESGDVYDVDFFLKGAPNNMTITETTVHKLNGKPYYTWKQDKEEESWYKVPVDQSDNSLLGVIEEEDHFEFTYEIQLPKIEGNGKIWVPVAESNEYQEVEVLNNSFPENSNRLKDSSGQNSAFLLELGPQYSRQKLSVTYSVSRKEKSPYAPTPSEKMELYLRPNTLIPVNDQFKKMAKDAIERSGANDTLMMARALFDYVIDSMKYIKDGKYGTGDAVYACDAQSGNCTEFHSFFIALARSSGIPARFGIGAAIPSNRDEGGVNGYHCWAEFYVDGKWWPVDISEANKYSALATYYFGHHPANRIEFSVGRDLRFDPLPNSGPINFFAYPVMEVDNRIVRPEITFTFERK